MKQILITGASSGIGLASAKAFKENGWQVTGLARDFTKTQFDFDRAVAIDLSQIENLNTQLNGSELGNPDCLLLNAGVGLFGGLEQLSIEQIQYAVNLNLISNLVLVKHFLPQFKRDGGKDIVLIGSEAGLQGAKQGSVYCATKFALRGFAQSLRADCAAAGIRVVLINPGPAQTHFFDDLHFTPKDGDDYSISAKSIADAILQAIALPRNVVQEEITLQPIKRAFDKK